MGFQLSESVRMNNVGSIDNQRRLARIHTGRYSLSYVALRGSRDHRAGEPFSRHRPTAFRPAHRFDDVIDDDLFPARDE